MRMAAGCPGVVFHGSLAPVSADRVENWETQLWQPLHEGVGDAEHMYQVRPRCVLESFTHLRFDEHVQVGTLRVEVEAPVEMVAAIHPENPSCFPAAWRRCMLPGSDSRLLTTDGQQQQFYRLYHTVLTRGQHDVPLGDPTAQGYNVFTLFARVLPSIDAATPVELLTDEGPTVKAPPCDEGRQWSARPASQCRMNPALGGLAKLNDSAALLSITQSRSLSSNSDAPMTAADSEYDCGAIELDSSLDSVEHCRSPSAPSLSEPLMLVLD